MAYSIVDFQRTPVSMPIHSYIWDISNPNKPEMELEPVSQLLCLKFNLKDNNLLGGGMYNGQFGFFDIRKGSLPVDVHSFQLLKSLRAVWFRSRRLKCVIGIQFMTLHGCSAKQEQRR